MTQDKYSAVWVSHSSIGDFLKCPRSYYLKNVYRDTKTGRKISISNPALSLGQAVHATLEGLKNFPVNERLPHNLLLDFEENWKKVSGKLGGFKNNEEEHEVKQRGYSMIERVIKNPGPISRKTVLIKLGHNGMPSNFYLSEEENIILCGLIDWLEYIEYDDSIVVLDFKTGKNDEKEDSLQLPIYLLLLNTLQKRKVSGARYWYIDRDANPVDMPLPNVEESRERVLKIALEIKTARQEKSFRCPRGVGGCFACKPYEMIINGKAEYAGVGDQAKDIYVL